MDNLSLLSVAGVFEDVPEHTDLPMKVVASYETLKAHPDNYGYNEDWGGISSNTQLFIVAKEGKISDVKGLSSHGHGMEEEAMRVIKKGPDWVPAIQNGRNVKAYRKQPITFVVASE